MWRLRCWEVVRRRVGEVMMERVWWIVRGMREEFMVGGEVDGAHGGMLGRSRVRLWKTK